MAPSVLLINLVVIDRFQQGYVLPYLAGALEEAGIPHRTVVCGVEAARGLVPGTFDVSLAPADEEALAEAVRAMGPSHCIFSSPPGDHVVRAIERVRPILPDTEAAEAQDAPGGEGMLVTRDTSAIRTSYLTDLISDEVVELPSGRQQGVLEWLGLEGGELRLWHRVDPSFREEPIGSMCARHDPLPVLVVGSLCRYARQIPADGVFQGVDLDGCKTAGCSFCTFGTFDAPKGDLFHRLALLLERLAKTAPMWSGRPRIRIIGEELYADVDRMCEVLAGSTLPASDVLFEARAKLLPPREAALDAGLTRLEPKGHCLHITSMGVESFSDDELERFNKGATSIDMLDALSVLVTMEERHPGTFSFVRHGGMSTILYTPWSRIRDVELSLRAVTIPGLEAAFGKLVRSRVRLYPTLPLHALAHHDGLLTDGYDDPFFETARLNFYPPEAPWRFQHDEVTLLNRLLARLTPTDLHEDDPLYQTVHTWQRSLQHEGEELPMALAIIDSVKLRGTERPVEAILDDAGQLLTAEPCPPLVSPSLAAFRRAAVLEGIKPVAKQEGVPSGEVSRLADELRTELSPDLAVMIKANIEKAGAVDVFYGMDESTVRGAVEATRSQDEAHDDGAMAAPIRDVGALLGYPRCCSEAFGELELFFKTHSEWRLVELLTAPPGRGLGALFPALLVHDFYTPCSLECEASAELAHRLEPLWQELVAGPEGPFASPLDAPAIVVSPPRRGAMAVLSVPAERPEGPCPYRVVELHGADEPMAMLLQGDEIWAEGPYVHLYRGGSRLYTFAGDLMVAFEDGVGGDPAFFASLCRLTNRSSTREAPAEDEATVGAFARAVGAVVARYGAAFERKLGTKIVSVSMTEDMVAVAMEPREGGRVDARIERASPGARAYLRGERVLVSHDSSTPLDTPAKRRAVKGLFLMVDRKLDQAAAALS